MATSTIFILFASSNRRTMLRSPAIVGAVASFYFHFQDLNGQASCERKREKQHGYDFNWDHRKEMYNESDGAISGAVHQIVLIRHGQYMHKETGDEKQVLTDLGRSQASRTGTRMSELVKSGIVFPIDKVYYSTMSRATETWQLIRQELKTANLLPNGEHRIQPCTMIREGAVCKPNPPASAWEVTEEEFINDNMRVNAAFASYFHRSLPEQTTNYSTVLVCHGNIIRYMVMKALQLPTEAWLRSAVWNASITIIEIYPSGKVSLRCLGDVGHMPADKITYN